MATIDRILNLSLCQLRVLARDWARLIAFLSLPLLAGVLLGLAGGPGSHVKTFGLFVILPVSALMLLISGLRGDGLLPGTHSGLVSPTVVHGSAAFSAIVVLVLQAIIYVVLTAVLGAGAVPGTGPVILALVLSVAVGTTVSILIPSRVD